MAIKEIAAKFIATCDGCRKEVSQTGKSRPAHWTDFHLLRDAYDWQGAACADASIRLLLCKDCADTATQAVNTALELRRAALNEGEK